jgi:hypothetical protein
MNRKADRWSGGNWRRRKEGKGRGGEGREWEGRETLRGEEDGSTSHTHILYMCIYTYTHVTYICGCLHVYMKTAKGNPPNTV